MLALEVMCPEKASVVKSPQSPGHSTPCSTHSLAAVAWEEGHCFLAATVGSLLLWPQEGGLCVYTVVNLRRKDATVQCAQMLRSGESLVSSQCL